MSFMIDFSGSGAYSGPFEGGTDLLPFQGYTYGRVTAATEGESKPNDNGGGKNKTVVLEILVEEAGAAGMKLMKTQAVSGIRKDKKPNALGMLDILFSAYSGVEATPEDAMKRVRALEGQSIDASGICAELLGKTVWVDVAARTFTRKDGTTSWSSDVRNFVGKQRYVDALATKIHHRDNPKEAMESRLNGPAVVVPANGSDGGAGSARSSASKVL